MIEDQRKVTSDEAEQEFKDAEKAFEEKNKTIATQQLGEETKAVSNPKDLPHTAKENQQILEALGFKRYEDLGVIKYNIRVLNIKIGVTFNETNPLGKIWAYKVPEGDENKEFLKNGELAEHPLVEKYIAIKEGKEPMPEISVTGKILEKRGKAIKIEIEENGEKKEIFFGQGAVKTDKDGHFVPAGFSKSGKDKEGKERDAKMNLPRDIRLPDYEVALKSAPIADITKEKDAQEEKVDKGTIADKIPHKKPVTLAEGEDPTVDYYISLIGEITEKVEAEERIAERERGYAISKVYDAITKDRRARLIATLKNGGDHEGQV